MRRFIHVHAAEVWLLHFNTTRPLTAGTFIAANVAAVQQNAMQITKQLCGRGTNTLHSTLGIHIPFKCYYRSDSYQKALHYIGFTGRPSVFVWLYAIRKGFSQPIKRS